MVPSSHGNGGSRKTKILHKARNPPEPGMELPAKPKMLRVFTIGHSNRSFEQFLSLLKEFRIWLVADIRRYPSSRKFPHFNRLTLSERLSVENIQYLWLEALGGRRHGSENNPLGDALRQKSPNTGLKSLGFRNYADYMATHQFHIAIEELLSKAVKAPTVVMCAEKLYWKCHRQLLSDYLAAQSVEVVHIEESGKVTAHKLTAGAVITMGAGVVYPSQPTLLKETS